MDSSVVADLCICSVVVAVSLSDMISFSVVGAEVDEMYGSVVDNGSINSSSSASRINVVGIVVTGLLESSIAAALSSRREEGDDGESSVDVETSSVVVVEEGSVEEVTDGVL